MMIMSVVISSPGPVAQKSNSIKVKS